MDPALDATALAELVRRRDVSPAELVDASIERIERLNPVINSVIHERFERARAEAVGDLPSGPFAGVPFLVKDLGGEMAGEPHHQGVAALRDAGYRAQEDSFVWQRLRRSGLVALGRTNVPEIGLTVTTEPAAYGPTRNPWDLDRSAGGSSGGSAAAVAAGIVPMAHASDGGGSIRIPAANCGLVGLKPTRGRVSKGPAAGDAWAGSALDGVVSRSVRDTAAALDVLSGPEVGDPYWATPPARPYSEEVGADPGRLRVGSITAIPDRFVHGECVAGVEKALQLLESLGHDVGSSSPDAFFEEAFSERFTIMVASHAAADVDTFSRWIGRPIGSEELEADNGFMVEFGRAVTAPQYLAAIDWIHAWRRRLAAWWVDHDILVTPVLGTPPPEIGWLRDPEHGTTRLLSILLFTAQFNASGQPAISLPLHWSDHGLPVGVQLVAAYGREDILLQVAAQLEQLAPWAGRHPPLFG